MIKSFKPVYSILPAAQKQIWPQLKEIKSLGFVLYGGTALALRYGHRQSIDIATLLEHGMSLEYGLASTVALFGKTFSPVDCLRALEYFDDPALITLSESYKLVLKKK